MPSAPGETILDIAHVASPWGDEFGFEEGAADGKDSVPGICAEVRKRWQVLRGLVLMTE